ncbi:MAG TPA: hypothetical protein VGF76_22790 [Polyangiaceae bacterium]
MCRCLALLAFALVGCSSSSPPASLPATGAAGSGGGSTGDAAGGGSPGGAGASGSAAGGVVGEGLGGAGTTVGGASGGVSGAATGGVSGGAMSGGGGAAGLGVSGQGGSSTGACTGLLCEDFEQGQGQLDTTKWEVQKGGGGIEAIQGQTVAHGMYALHVQGTGARGDFATIMTKNLPPALQGAGPVFGRAYLYATTNLSAHIELGFAGTTRDAAVAPLITTNGLNFNYMEFAHFSGSWQLGFDLFNPAPSIAKGFVEEASYPPAKDKAPAAKWNCIEWEFGDAPAMMVLWVDGKQIDQFDAQHIDYTSAARTPGSVLNGQSNGIIGGFTVYGFGFHSWGASTVVDRYYDDIVLDTKRVNCLL